MCESSYTPATDPASYRRPPPPPPRPHLVGQHALLAGQGQVEPALHGGDVVRPSAQRQHGVQPRPRPQVEHAAVLVLGSNRLRGGKAETEKPLGGSPGPRAPVGFGAQACVRLGGLSPSQAPCRLRPRTGCGPPGRRAGAEPQQAHGGAATGEACQPGHPPGLPPQWPAGIERQRTRLPTGGCAAWACAHPSVGGRG